LFILAVVLIFLLKGNCYAQNEAKIRVILEASDVKKLEKADLYLDDADKLMEAANRLYMETFTIQGNYELDEKTKGKKVKQTEGQARQKITEASALYQKGNEIKYGLFKTYLEKFWSGYQGDETAFINAKLIEEQSNDFYYQALVNRTEANKMPDGNEKIQKLNQAAESENRAIDKQITALGLYYGIDLTEAPAEEASPVEADAEPYPAETIETTAIPQSEVQYQPVITEQPQPAQPEVQYQPEVTETPETKRPEMPYYPAVETQPDTLLPGQIVINQPMIELYNRYVISQGRPEDSVSTTGFANISYFDAERILQLWNAYLDRSFREEQQQPFLAEALPDTGKAVSAESGTIPVQQFEEVQIAVVDNERQAQQIPADENVVYRVQIAADKTELSQRALQRIYFGNKSVEMLEENGWYKYSVGDFATYADASKFRKSCNVKNAFIVAYRKGQRFLAGIAEEAEKKAISMSAAGDRNMPAGLVFRIQVAASRAQLTREQLARIYPGHYSVEEIEEEGWYKYQLLGVRLFSDALGILKDIPVNRAFVSAYEDGKKIELYEGVVKNRTLERTVRSAGRKNIRETEYHVQIAASRFPIKKEAFLQLYSGPDPVALIIEDGWYKYRIKAGNSYSLAKEIKARCGVEKAFIVSYKRARKIALYEAIRDINP